jgi:hypothetical protein
MHRGVPLLEGLCSAGEDFLVKRTHRLEAEHGQPRVQPLVYRHSLARRFPPIHSGPQPRKQNFHLAQR